MFFGLEELTKEELIRWVRENVPDLDEDEIVRDALIQRRDLICEARNKWSERCDEVNFEITALVQKHANGPIKSGVKLKSWPSEAKKEYERLNKLREEAWINYCVCSKKDNETNDKIIGISEKQIQRTMKTMRENWEKQNNGTEN